MREVSKNYICSDNGISVYSFNLESISNKNWEVIENTYKEWFYKSLDQRYLEGGVHIRMTRELLSFYLRFKNSYLLVAIKDRKIVGFSELYFGKTPVQYINQRKSALRSLGEICFTHIIMVTPDFTRNGVSLVLDKAKDLICMQLGVEIIISLICIKPVPNIASLSRAKKLGAYFSGLTFTTKRNDDLFLDNNDIEYTEVLYSVDRGKKISMCENTLVLTSQ